MNVLLELTTSCGAIGKLPPSGGEFPGAFLAGVRNQLRALCGQKQAEPQAEISPIPGMWGHFVVFTKKNVLLEVIFSKNASES